jgi:hypothetical protein
MYDEWDEARICFYGRSEVSRFKMAKGAASGLRETVE